MLPWLFPKPQAAGAAALQDIDLNRPVKTKRIYARLQPKSIPVQSKDESVPQSSDSGFIIRALLPGHDVLPPIIEQSNQAESLADESPRNPAHPPASKWDATCSFWSTFDRRSGLASLSGPMAKDGTVSLVLPSCPPLKGGVLAQTSFDKSRTFTNLHQPTTPVRVNPELPKMAHILPASSFVCQGKPQPPPAPTPPTPNPPEPPY
ncbi:hypothetical protein B0T21DRAFT_343421 [Apiosordaria backusii]|uniref:Uncharacterized protein n=1 Tax=Apiosordaria backusii TaxID=314023 RepID=A0AA40EY72_9PEZI|nr:hypothetical protein B0T21DRAFT_343421 [Apiosordaria backusii]